MTSLITGEEFERLFATFQHTAWRWEAQASYHEPYELEPLEQWRRGEPDDLARLADWLDDIRAATAAGRLFQRVRRYPEPPTEYLRWQENVTPANVEAGEDIRVVTADQAAELGLPGHDFWLFDNTQLVRMHFDASGFVGGEMITDPDVVAQHRVWRDIAWTHAVPYRRYRETHPARGTREQPRPGQTVTRDEHRTLVQSVARSAWRLEIQGTYNEPSEREPLRRYLAGEPDDLAWFARWLDRIRDVTAAGVRFERVRVLTEPLTDYLAYQLARITEPAVEAGEYIRILTPPVAAALDLPPVDFWVLDDERVLLPTFVDHMLVGGELVDDPADVARFLGIRVRAWDHAIPFREYMRS